MWFSAGIQVNIQLSAMDTRMTQVRTLLPFAGGMTTARNMP